MAKNRFRKIYLVIDGSNIFSQYNYEFIQVYRQKSHAEQVCKARQEAAIRDAKLEHSKNQPVAQYRVHGFYLVHDSLFQEDYPDGE